MAFNPSIPVPKSTEPKFKKGQHQYLSKDFKPFYKAMIKDNNLVQEHKKALSNTNQQTFDFYKELKCK